MSEIKLKRWNEMDCSAKTAEKNTYDNYKSVKSPMFLLDISEQATWRNTQSRVVTETLKPIYSVKYLSLLAESPNLRSDAP